MLYKDDVIQALQSYIIVKNMDYHIIDIEKKIEKIFNEYMRANT